MEVYKNEPKISGPIQGAVAVDSYVPGATLQLGSNGRVYTVAGRDVELAPEEGWDQINTTGTITLKVYRAPLQQSGRLGERPGFRGSQLGATVGGNDADGSAPTSNPLLVAGKDAGGLIRTLLADTLGHLVTVGDDLTSAQGALGALNAALSIATKGKKYVSISWPAAGNLIGTLKAEASYDGGTTYGPTYGLVPYFVDLWRAGFGQTPNNFRSQTVALLGAGLSTAFTIEVPPGASHVRVRVSAYTSGATPATTQLRATDQGPNWVYAQRSTELLASQPGAVAANFPVANIDVSPYDTIEIFINVTVLSAANNLLVNSVDENGDAYTIATLSVAAVAKVMAVVGKGATNNNPLGRAIQLVLSGGTPTLNYSVYGR